MRLKKTRSYQYLGWLKNFDHIQFINLFKFSELEEMTNGLINLMNKYREHKLKSCLNKSDIILFYKKWENLFKRKSKEYTKFIDKTIEDIIKDVRPYNENHKLSSPWYKKGFMKCDDSLGDSYIRFFSNLIDNS